MVDDYNRATWVHLLCSKSNTLQVIKAFVQLIENQFQTIIKTLRSDNSLEISSNEAVNFYQSKGIIHQNYYPYTPQQNIVVERKHKYLLEVTRALLFQSKLPLTYYREFIFAATYLVNRLSSVLMLWPKHTHKCTWSYKVILWPLTSQVSKPHRLVLTTIPH